MGYVFLGKMVGDESDKPEAELDDYYLRFADWEQKKYPDDFVILEVRNYRDNTAKAYFSQVAFEGSPTVSRRIFTQSDTTDGAGSSFDEASIVERLQTVLQEKLTELDINAIADKVAEKLLEPTHNVIIQDSEGNDVAYRPSNVRIGSLAELLEHCRSSIEELKGTEIVRTTN